MSTHSAIACSGRAWWLALLALAFVGPWPHLQAPFWALLALTSALAVLARPRTWQWSAWGAVAVALVIQGLALRPATVAPESLATGLERHCRSMLRLAERVAGDPELASLYAASGEITDPAMPFRLLEEGLGGRSGWTAYLCDDRGRVVAWGGVERAYPSGVRPLGPRRWGQVWSAHGVVHYLREPILLEGRLVGAVTVADFSTLETDSAFGMRAPRGFLLALGDRHPESMTVEPEFPPGVRLPVTPRPVGAAEGPAHWPWMPWLALAALGAACAPPVGALAVVVGGCSWFLAGVEPVPLGWAVIVALAVVVLRRVADGVAVWPARLLVGAGLVMLAAGGLCGFAEPAGVWLPRHLVRPGWGGMWMVVMAWTLAAWPSFRGRRMTLMRRLALSAALAFGAVVLTGARIPIDLWRAFDQGAVTPLPTEAPEISSLLPVAPARCDLAPFAPVLAGRWRLAEHSGPCALRLFDQEGYELSRWGELEFAGDEVELARSWLLPELSSGRLELWRAREPWSHLRDWRSQPSRGERPALRFVVFTREGRVAAALGPPVHPVPTTRAAELYHRGGGWTRVRDGESWQPALMRRSGEWLVAAVARPHGSADWVLRAAIAAVWAMVGLSLARPPAFRRQQLSTFGGRLRLLVAGGVVFPLVILTLFLQLRFQDEQARREQAVSLEALRSARYTAEHLGGGFAVDDELARWIAGGWGGEVVLFDGAEVVAASRPDYLAMGWLPELPAEKGFIAFVLGNDDPVAHVHGGEMAAAGAVTLGGRRLLLQLFRPGREARSEAPVAVDWLLTGAVLSALLALALSSRVERRLSVSLNDLVALARKLLHGEPVGQIRRPRETDLAEVLDAVRSMNQEVQDREISLQHQEELLRITLSTLSQAVVVLDPDGEIRFANPSAERLRAEHGPLMLQQIELVARNVEDESAPVVTTVEPLPGRDATWRIGVAAVPLPDGRRASVAAIDDVSDVVRADRLQQLAQMARIVAHEVKNPLTPIRLWVQELDAARRAGRSQLEELLAEACSEIAVQVGRLQDTANSFSNLVALEKWEATAVDLDRLVRDSLAGFSILERRGIRIGLDLPGAGQCVVVGDRQWLGRAVSNLVLNSVNAVGNDSEAELMIRLERRGERAVLEVEDSGGGVPESRLSELFSPHFSTTSSGSGLGLALVHNVVTRCQGSVAARNGKRGLVVRLELPVSRGSGAEPDTMST